MPQLFRKLSLLHCLLLFNAATLPVLAVATNADSKDEIVSPETIDGVTNVDANGLIELAINTPALVLIDSRITADRKEGYIEGSVSLPDIDTTCDSLGNKLPNLGNPVMFYCNGVDCGRSAKAAVIASDCGYTDIYWFRNGIEEWQAEEYPLVH